MKKLLLLSILAVALPAKAPAELVLSKLYGDQAVLQRDVPLPVTGRSTPGTEVTVAFAGQTKSAKADELGRWKVVLDPLPVSKEGRELTVTAADGSTLVRKDILVGDVWLAAGQSNMAFALNASLKDPESKGLDDPMVRIIQPKPGFSGLPHEDYSEGTIWLPANPKNLSWASAPAWFFASEVRRHQDIPLGMVIVARGGTGIQAFLPPQAHNHLEGFEEFPNLKKMKSELEAGDAASPAGREAFTKLIAEVDGWLSQSKSALEQARLPGALPAPSSELGGMHNLLLHPLREFPIKGMLWYQGESNGGDKKLYYHLLNAFLKGLRGSFQSGDFPIYIVQLAPFIFKSNDPEGEGSAGVRESQREVAATLPNSGLVVTLDIGTPDDIHPPNKVDVGKRLAFLALHRDYGMKDIIPSGPSLKSHSIEGDTIVLEFDHVGGGLMAGTKKGTDAVQESKEPFQAFQLAGDDKKFVPATATVQGNKITLKAAGVSSPKYARYAYSANPQGPLLYNKEGLPASSFKTDPW